MQRRVARALLSREPPAERGDENEEMDDNPHGLPWRVAPWGDGSTPCGLANILSDAWQVVIASELLTERAEFIVATVNGSTTVTLPLNPTEDGWRFESEALKSAAKQAIDDRRHVLDALGRTMKPPAKRGYCAAGRQCHSADQACIYPQCQTLDDMQKRIDGLEAREPDPRVAALLKALKTMVSPPPGYPRIAPGLEEMARKAIAQAGAVLSLPPEPTGEQG